MVSKSARYAIWVLAALARDSGNGYLRSRGLARRLGIPGPYLAKILFILLQKGLVESVRGRSGGYRLKPPAASMSLKSVVEIFEPEALERMCIIGSPECPGAACLGHRNWATLQNSFIAVMEGTSIADIA
jgi:Rrf2 family protein